MTHEDDCVEPGEDVMVLAELTEKITRRLEAGEPVSGGAWIGDPASAYSIRQLLPTLRSLLAIGVHFAREEGSITWSQQKSKEHRHHSIISESDVEEVGP